MKKTYFVQQDKWRNVRLAITVGGQVRNLVNDNSDENLLLWIKMGPTAPVPGQRVKYSAKNSWNHFKVNFRFLCNIAIICRGFHYPHRQKRRWLRSPDTARYLVCLAASDADSWGRTHQHQLQLQLGEVTHIYLTILSKAEICPHKSIWRHASSPTPIPPMPMRLFVKHLQGTILISASSLPTRNQWSGDATIIIIVQCLQSSVVLIDGITQSLYIAREGRIL